MSFITYIKENSDLLNDDDDKNPLFYLPVIIKVSAGKTTEELKDDYQLKSLLNQIEKLKKNIGKTNIKNLSGVFIPAMIIDRKELEDCKTKNSYKEFCKSVLKEMKIAIISSIHSFNESYKISKSIEEFENSKEFEDFFNTLEIRK